MLIFNGKTYFVPFIGSDKVAGADAKPDQVVKGVKFVGAKGVVETGVLPIHEGFLTPDEMRDYDGDDNLYVSCPMERSLVKGGVAVKIPLVNFGNATAADVRKGKRFTSADGWYEEGEMPTIALPEATIHFDVDSGRILSVVTNNEDGFVEKGETSAYTYLRTKKAAVIEPSNTTQIAVQKNYWTTGDVTVAPVPDYYIDASDMSVFGNASPMSVMSNVTFTSEDGVKIWGALENLSEDDLNRARFDDEDNNDADDFKFRAEAKQRGVVEGGISFKVPKTNFGFVTPDLVPEGYTFTSMYGFNTGGTMPVFEDTLIRLSLTDKYVTLDSGYHSDTTVEILTEKEKEVTPTKEGVTVSPKTGYVLSTVKVKGDNNLIPENIAEGVSIFGIDGTHKGGASIKTCKLTVTRSTTTGQSMITATTFDGTNFVPVTLRTYSGTDTIENIVCGSVVHIETQYMTSLYGWAYGKTEMGSGGSINIPNETGDYTVDIGALDDD